jgi:CheY-like chemotaxis protein
MGNVAAETVGTRASGWREQHMSLRRVLVVEDEMVVAMLVEDMIAELGYEVAGVVSRVEDAMKLVGSDKFDVAVLDVHLNGRLIFPFADALAARHIPFMFATGYGERGIPREHSSCPVIQKPFRAEDLKRALARLEAT